MFDFNGPHPLVVLQQLFGKENMKGNMLYTSFQFSDGLGFDWHFSLHILFNSSHTSWSVLSLTTQNNSFRNIKVPGKLLDIKNSFCCFVSRVLPHGVFISAVGVTFSNSPEDAPRADGVCVHIPEHHSFAGRTTSSFSFFSFSPSNTFNATKECG